MQRSVLLWLCSVFVSTGAYAKGQIDLSHKKWNTLLQETVVSKLSGQITRVNYALLKTKDSQLTSYLKEISEVSEQDFQALPRDDQMAFLFNAYNAGMAKLVVDSYPVSSVKKIGIPFVGPWKNTFIMLFGKKMSPDDLEHKTLRKIYKDPRIHFAVNCASISCPPLRLTAFTGSQLQSQLDEQAKLFFGNKTENLYSAEKNELRLNSILSWFREDFTKTNDSELVTYVTKFMPELASIPASKIEKMKIIYNDYDWNLNDTN